MKIRALVKVGSHLHRSWTHANFIKREFYSALFVKQRGGQFVAEDLSAQAADQLKTHPCIIFEMQTVSSTLPPEDVLSLTDTPSVEPEEIVDNSVESELPATPRRGRPKKTV
jgi:hypothetical protein